MTRAISASAAALLLVLLLPGRPAAVPLPSSPLDTPVALARPLPAWSPVPPATNPGSQVASAAFSGTPAVGALFQASQGVLGRHFCSAAVVDSPHADLVITAAHCVATMAASQIAFVPGYYDGIAPYGIWLATAVIADSAWTERNDPNHDVAFLVVTQAGSSARIQDLTGGEQLGIGWRVPVPVRVIAYPDGQFLPIGCRSSAHRPAHPTLPLSYEANQLEFDCGGYTDGTSGGPFLARVDARTGRGTVIGVIGGYEQGGDRAAVSYAARFGPAVRSLYQAAVRRS